MKFINHNWINTLLIVAVGILVLVGSNQSGVGAGTRFPSGLSVDGTSPSSGEVRSTTLTTTGAATLSSVTLSSTLAVTATTTLASGLILSEAAACVNFNATSTATAGSLTFVTTGATSTHAGTVYWDFGACD